MVDLVPYISTQQKKGFKQSSIKEILLKYGHKQEEIDKAFDDVYHTPIQQVHHTLHLSWKTIFGISFIILMAVTGAFIGINLAKPSTQLLDIEANPKNDVLHAGDELFFTINLVNLGKETRYDLTLKHEIFEPNGFISNEKEETVAIETRGSVESRIKIPSNSAPGKYKLRTTAYYNGQNAKTSFTFTIINPDSITTTTEVIGTSISTTTTEKITTTTITAPDITSTTKGITTTTLPTETCEDNIWNQDENGLDCGGKYCEPCIKGTLDITKELNKYSNAKDMMNYCILLPTVENRDNCFYKIAKKKDDPKYCEPLTELARDDCYFYFANMENFISDKTLICNLIIDQVKKDTCDSLYKFSNFGG